MGSELNRREFMKGSLLATAGGALALGAVGNAHSQNQPAAPEIKPAPADFPQGQIGKVKLSRLILGSNLITFYIHARELKFVNNLARHYFTEAKILETLAVAEANGVNTIMTQDDAQYLSILKKYRDQGGKLQWIIAPKVSEDVAETRENIRKLVDDGVAALYIHGNQADKFVAAGQLDVIKQTLESIKLNDIPAGVGGHDLNVVKYCEENKVENDFYVKTFHHHNYKSGPRPEDLAKPDALPYAEIPGYWCKSPEDTSETFKKIEKPWIAFKVMAAGAIPPASAFKYVYQNGADFVLAGMFDFEIAEDVKIAKDAIAAAARRPRPWRG